MDAPHWEHIEHDADIGLRASAPTRESALEAMGEALTALVCDPKSVRSMATVEIRCDAPDNATLLVDWLNALVFEMSARNMLFGEFHVRLNGCRLEAIAAGERVDRLRHQPVVEVKGATYTALVMEQDSGGTWHAQCIVDV